MAPARKTPVQGPAGSLQLKGGQLHKAEKTFKERKAELRHNLAHRRDVIPRDLISTTRWKVMNNLRPLISEISPAVVALYSAVRGEIDLADLAVELWNDGQTVALPRVVQRGHPLVFNVWPAYGGLEPDALGIPAAMGPEIHPALVVVPMLGYNRQGYRLGTGGGYYDKTLKEIPYPLITVGVCYTELEIDDFPAEPHDVKLDYIVTGKEVITC